jgi:dienelactone hydrolase
MAVRPVVFAMCILLVCACLAGCTGAPAKPSYSVDKNGILSLTCVPVTAGEEVLFSNGTYTKSRIVLHTQDGDVVTYLGAPAKPTAAIVYVPGAGEKVAGHEDRMVRYAAAGYAFLFVDIRGNGAETKGYAFNPQMDLNRFEKGDWPQYYQIICDLVTARQMLDGRLHVPVYAMGSSNGGRYAAVAAAVDPQYAGYVGISTSDWGIRDAAIRQGYTGDVIRFTTSLEPCTYISKISPRPVWMFHNATDPIIPFESGKELFSYAEEPKKFAGFAGDHGINSDVDDRIIAQWAQIYDTRG